MFLLPRKRRAVVDTSSSDTTTPTVTLASSQTQLHNEVTPRYYSSPPTPTQQHSSAAFVQPPHASSPSVLAKRTFSCRICGHALSSASNRLRHERSKHGADETHRPGLKRARSTFDSSVSALVEEEPLSIEFDALEYEFDTSTHMALYHVPGGVTSDSDASNEIPADSSSQPELVIAESEDLSHVVTSPADSSADHSQPQQQSPSSPPPPGPSLQDTQLQTACLPFLQWMCQPPISQIEALIKARRVKAMTQLQPVKLNLRFVFSLLLAKGVIETPDLQCLTRLQVCKILSEALDERKVGSARIHAVFLLVKKVLVYLASRDSTQQRQYLAPTCHASYMYVECICSDSSHRRKQEARNRAALGVQTSKLLHKSQPASQRGLLSLPAGAFDMPSMLGPLETCESPPSPPRLVHVPAAAMEHDDPSPNELTREELKSVAAGAMAYLRDHRDGAYFMHHLVVATLSLGLAPRSQVLKQLRIGSSFVKEADGRYWVRVLAELNKNGRPTVFALPVELTEPFDHYFHTLRPRLLVQSGNEHDYVFFKKNGTAPRADFSELTSLATQQLIGRPVNAHAFRSAVVTTFYQTGATQSQMDVLANIMAHDPATARTYYFKPQMAQAAIETGERMMDALV